MDQIFTKVESEIGYEITVNLEKQKIYDESEIADFEIDSFKKSCLIDGLDDIGLSMEKIDNIDNYEKKIKSNKPWIMQND